MSSLPQHLFSSVVDILGWRTFLPLLWLGSALRYTVIMWTVAFPLFVAIVWILIGGVVSILSPGVVLFLSFCSMLRRGCQKSRTRRIPKSAGYCKPARVAGPAEVGVDAKFRQKDKANKADDDDLLSSERGVRGIPAFLGTVETNEGFHRRACDRAALITHPPVQRHHPRCRSHPVARDLDLFIDEPTNLTVVLDLDETLVRSCEEEDVPVHLELAALMGKLIKLEVQCVGTSQSSSRVVTFLRPGLYEFLERVSRLADIYIFTAGEQDYARPLVQLLDHDGKFILGSYFRETTVATTIHDHVKDLTRLGFDLTRTVLVDNNPYSFLFQPDNGILCEPFYGEPADRHLLDVVLPALHLLARVSDVRPILRRRYNIAGWCQTLGDWY